METISIVLLAVGAVFLLEAGMNVWVENSAAASAEACAFSKPPMAMPSRIGCTLRRSRTVQNETNEESALFEPVQNATITESHSTQRGSDERDNSNAWRGCAW